MKKRTTKATASSRRPVEVVIAVTKFVEVLGTNTDKSCGIAYTMKLRRSDSRASIDGDNLRIRRPGAEIRFFIAAGPGDRDRYYPTGITFVREAESKGDKQRLGLYNFPQNHTRAEGRSLWIRDVYRDGAKRVRYKFSVLVQRGSDGKIGIIDPGIIHEDE